MTDQEYYNFLIKENLKELTQSILAYIALTASLWSMTWLYVPKF